MILKYATWPLHSDLDLAENCFIEANLPSPRDTKQSQTFKSCLKVPSSRSPTTKRPRKKSVTIHLDSDSDGSMKKKNFRRRRRRGKINHHRAKKKDQGLLVDTSVPPRSTREARALVSCRQTIFIESSDESSPTF
jgi:hypothetical protein